MQRIRTDRGAGHTFIGRFFDGRVRLQRVTTDEGGSDEAIAQSLHPVVAEFWYFSTRTVGQTSPWLAVAALEPHHTIALQENATCGVIFMSGKAS